MLEMMLAVKPRSMNLYPDSGPGPQVLKYGNEDLGLFGTLPSSILITEMALRNQLNYWSGTSPGVTTWVKMFVDGKIIFFPASTMAMGVTFKTLYDAGITTGDKDEPDVGYPLVPQLTYAFIEDRVYKARLFRRTITNPEVATTTPVNAGQALVSEVGRVMNAAVMWKAITSTAYNTTCWCGTTNRISAGTGHIFDATTLSQDVRISVKGWVPVLELLPKDQVPLLAVNAFEQISESAAVPTVPMLGDSTTAVIPILRPVSGGLTVLPTLPTPAEYTDYVKGIPNTSKTYLTTMPIGVIPSITYE